MHIPDQMLHGAICPVTAAFSAIGISAAAYAAFRSKEKPSRGRFAAVTALLFAGQMMNFPIAEGTSGHLLGGVLAAMLLGVPYGVLAMAMVVTVQCLAFADGGLSVLGANLFNMAIIGTGVGGYCAKLMGGMSTNSSLRRLTGTAIGAWMGTMLAALAVSAELALDGAATFTTVAPAMLGVHALIGLGEAAITVVAVCLVGAASVTASTRATWVPAIGAGVIALALSPFACAWPDGLESVAGHLQFLKASEPLFVAPLADYAMPYISNEALATGLAGLAGVALTFALSYILGTLAVLGARKPQPVRVTK